MHIVGYKRQKLNQEKTFNSSELNVGNSRKTYSFSQSSEGSKPLFLLVNENLTSATGTTGKKDLQPTFATKISVLNSTDIPRLNISRSTTVSLYFPVEQSDGRNKQNL